jgi:hypothetical protein
MIMQANSNLSYNGILTQDFTDATLTREDISNILKALWLTGGCDERTLAIVAQAVGLTWQPPTVLEVQPNERQ